MRRSTMAILCSVALLFLGRAAPALAMNGMAMNGTPATATVSFGAWHTDPPLDRFPNSSPGDRNEHQLIPNTVTIEAGGTVNFIISGFHQVIVYDDGTQLGDINVEETTPTTGVPAGVPLINDPTNRLYRGPDPSLPNLCNPAIGWKSSIFRSLGPIS
jgi:hypothetical protein